MSSMKSKKIEWRLEVGEGTALWAFEEGQAKCIIWSMYSTNTNLQFRPYRRRQC